MTIIFLFDFGKRSTFERIDCQKIFMLLLLAFLAVRRHGSRDSYGFHTAAKAKGKSKRFQTEDVLIPKSLYRKSIVDDALKHKLYPHRAQRPNFKPISPYDDESDLEQRKPLRNHGGRHLDQYEFIPQY